MSAFKHTPEPWKQALLTHTIRGGKLRMLVPVGSEESTIIYVETRPDNDQQVVSELSRVVSCVNGCKGIPDPETTVPELVAAIKAHLNPFQDRQAAHEAMLAVLAKLEETT